MIVCVCHRVSDRDIARYASHGMGDFTDMQFDLRAGTCCGRCEDCAREVFDAARPEHALRAQGLSGGLACSVPA